MSACQPDVVVPTLLLPATPLFRGYPEDPLPSAPPSPHPGNRPGEPQQGHPNRLTVREQSKVDVDRCEQAHKTQTPSCLLTVIKWVVVSVLAVSFTFCLVFSKLSVIFMGTQLQALRHNGSHDHDDNVNVTVTSHSSTAAGVESVFLLVVISIEVPYVNTLARALWCGAFRKDRPWPSFSALCLGAISAVLESLGLTLFAIIILSESVPYISVLLMNGVFLVHIIYCIVKYIRDRLNSHRFLLVMFVAALCCELIGMILTGIFELAPGCSKCSKTWAIPLSLLFLSFSWSPSTQKLQLYPKVLPRDTEENKSFEYRDMVRARSESERFRQHLTGHNPHSSGAPRDISESVTNPNLTNQRAEADSHPTNQRAGTDSHPTNQRAGTKAHPINHRPGTESDLTNQRSRIGSDTQIQTSHTLDKLLCTNPEYSARWKVSIISNALKVLLVPPFSIMFGHFLDVIYLDSLKAGFHHLTPSHPAFVPFITNITTSFLGNLLGWMACTMCVQKTAFALPLILATPLSLALELAYQNCEFSMHKPALDCDFVSSDVGYVLPVAACLYLAQILSTTYFIFTSQTIAMQKESMIFWLPGYSSVFLEQWLLLGRKTRQTDSNQKDATVRSERTRVYICTTMYREAACEMEQLLHSLAAINQATQQSDCHFESHVFFDNGVRERRLTDFALQLVTIVQKTFGLTSEECTKLVTPYGLRLTWQLPALVTGKHGMELSIHLKDNVKVKNKKRWSQVMYMSYVLDYHIRENDQATEEETYILTTDADVKFSPESVEALLDLMTRDSTVGAVCARTFPMGSGPVVWYQVFDYAIGHWFQKTANHVLGSVLCCPGCFSVYRAAAVRQVLPTYASQVTKASEFLTKDMGEDRWLCTLLVQSGWRLEYCAAAHNSTYCPEDFNEFFKQRRRWIPSTLANQLLLIQEWSLVSCFNTHISWLFLVYQGALLFSTLISPSMCVLIISGGLFYAWEINQVFSTLALLAVIITYVLVCLNTTQDTQLKGAKLLTVLFAFVMAAVVIGTATQIVDEIQHEYTSHGNYTTASPRTTTTGNHTTPPMLLETPTPSYIQTILTYTPLIHTMDSATPTTLPEIPLPASATTLYLGGLACLFLLAAILHLPEAYCLLSGVCYLLCLPAGYLILMVYSLCNVTDRSWGTREDKTVTAISGTRPWYDSIVKGLKKMVPCCWKAEESEMTDKCIQTSGPPSLTASNQHDTTNSSSLTWPALDRSSSFQFHYEGQHYDLEAISVRDWLPRNFRDMYALKFEAHGYDDTSFIADMTDKDLRSVGVTIKGHRKAILEEVKTLPEPNIEPYVPDTVDEWLEAIGLLQYRENFRTLHIVRRCHLQVLKAMTPSDLTRELHITKSGHFKRLLLAIKHLRHPTEDEREMSKVRGEIEALRTYFLEDVNQREFHFWEALRMERLQPDTAAFAQDQDVKEKLTALRNSSLLVFGVSNLLWIILIMTLVSKTQLNVLGTNALGLCFLVIFGFIIIIQFLCMLVHRVATWVHLIARAPYCCGAPYNSTWSFGDTNLENKRSLDLAGDSTDEEAMRQKHQINDEMRRNYRERIRSRYQSSSPSHRQGPMATVEETTDEKQPLISKKKRSVNGISSTEEDNA